LASFDRQRESLQPSDAPENTGVILRLRLYRRVLPFPIALILLLVFRPQLWGHPSVDAFITAAGFLLCGTGEMLRLWAWGSNAVVGKSGVRDRGAYALMRHPLYAGNFLIAAGLAVVYNHLAAYLLLPFSFALMYGLITGSEERLMLTRFPEYQNYQATSLPRFVPELSNLGAAIETTSPFGWHFAWRKEYPSCCAWLAGLSGLELYKDVLAYGWAHAWPGNLHWIAAMAACTVLMLALGRRKPRGKS
jgi:protein-S-isoprenylcysteine O-methyltransferase Ste14